jgi:excisionase family DNA binding protein
MKGRMMAQDNQLLTTREFATRTGIPTAKVSKLIREGKIKAEKKSGKWMIHPSELKVKIVQKAGGGSASKPGKTAAKAPQKKAAAGVEKSARPEKDKVVLDQRTYTIAEFAEMTYLTEFGVGLWLKQGRLTAKQNEKGEWLIDASSLQVPDVKRLIREDKAP